MNQSWPHYQAQVILPELVCNYSDMPIQRHVCESSFFLPVEQLYKTTGGVARQRFPGWFSIILAICIRPLVGAVGFQLRPTSLITLKWRWQKHGQWRSILQTPSKDGSDRFKPRCKSSHWE